MHLNVQRIPVHWTKVYPPHNICLYLKYVRINIYVLYTILIMELNNLIKIRCGPLEIFAINNAPSIVIGLINTRTVCSSPFNHTLIRGSKFKSISKPLHQITQS